LNTNIYGVVLYGGAVRSLLRWMARWFCQIQLLHFVTCGRRQVSSWKSCRRIRHV